MNRKNVVYNWDFKIMKNANDQIFASGAVLALKSRFYIHFIIFLAHFWFSTPKYWLKLITMNRKSVAYNWDIKII